MDKIILKANKICKAYKNGDNELSVLNDFSLELKQNQIITITGQSGSGKSTALNILGTLDSPDSGFLEINGLKIDNLNEYQLSKIRNENIGFVFQFHHLLSEFTSLENVLIPAWIKNSSSNKKEEAIELFEKLKLTPKLNNYPNQLSGGERARIALIRAIINKPSILLADEPTGNLDNINAKKLIDLLIQISQNFGQSMIITTHNPDVASIGQKKFLLENGYLKNKEK
tara:strand:+ start:241 stop:924 length:684 start_codon:yes stop_codon:yes gene_type:complete